MKPDMSGGRTPNSVVLTDWAAGPEGLGQSLEAGLYELLLLSLLYDEVLIQDEVFAVSDKMARWARTAGSRDMLRKCLELGSVVVLKHPLGAYPTNELKEQSHKQPILARANYIQTFGTKGQHRFKPSPTQLSLHCFVDRFLLGHSGSQRYVDQRFEIMPAFAAVLQSVLSSQHHAKWLKRAFKGVDAMRDDFLRFLEKPETVLVRLKKAGRDYVAPTGPEGIPIFNRSLAYQAAGLYEPRSARAMQRLVQTTFAAPFCWREAAAGRYSRSLRELLLVPSESLTEAGGSEHMDSAVSVEASVHVRMDLPDLSTDFVEAVARVRNSEAGKRLRRAVRQVGSHATFHRQESAWLEVADELAGSVTQRKTITIRAALVSLGRRLVAGCVAAGLLQLSGMPTTVPTALTGAFASASVALVGRHIYEVMRSDLVHQKLSGQLEHAVRFRCVSPALPPLPAGIAEVKE